MAKTALRQFKQRRVKKNKKNFKLLLILYANNVNFTLQNCFYFKNAVENIKKDEKQVIFHEKMTNKE